ncbi:MAG: hypothetical protein Q8933_08485 [Bacteroidota bacterium]|nr:hypothetical protein [Bacteroidota bacterium]MDP4192902.1 hypothetical protein [Bacteroidota bacterium]MDP4196854.1 hypothetical protein [Bacteroidota bacterium]
MNKIIVLFFIMSFAIVAQTFKVEKVSGKVLALRGTSENWTDIKQGDKLSGSDLLVTGENSYIQLSKDASSFLLKSNSALGLNSIKKLSVDELLLALASEEIKNVPKNKSDSKTKTTAVYGSKIDNKLAATIPANDLGLKKINGAKQLAESGFKESSVLVAKETFRKYPDMQKRISDRIYFADILERLGVYDEAYSEFLKINGLAMKDSERSIVKAKLESLSKKISK